MCTTFVLRVGLLVLSLASGVFAQFAHITNTNDGNVSIWDAASRNGGRG